MRRRTLVAIAVAFCLAVVLTRVFWDGRAALSAGDDALARGDRAEAIARWRRAARWYAPGAPHVARAYARLEALALDAEGKGDCALALEAWRAVRSSSLATRSFYTPYAAHLARANRRIAVLMALEEARGAGRPVAGCAPEALAGADEDARQFHQALLDKDEAPSVFWSIVALLGLAGWIGGGLLFAWRGVTPDDKLDPKAAAVAGVLVAAGLLVWMLGLYVA